jgi:hypothetical protein
VGGSLQKQKGMMTTSFSDEDGAQGWAPYGNGEGGQQQSNRSFIQDGLSVLNQV